MMQTQCFRMPMAFVGWLGITTSIALAQNKAVPSQAAAISASKPNFEVASIKLDKSQNGASVRLTPDGLEARNATLQMLILFAYDLTHDPSLMVGDRLIPGAEPWVHSDGYSIQAKIADSDRSALQGLNRKQQSAQAKRMLQALLADRFKLEIHFEPKEFPAYALAVTKDGPKNMKKEEDGSTRSFGRTRTHLDFHASPVSELAQILTLDLGRPVLDKTGILGKCDFTLDWEPERDQGQGIDPPAYRSSQQSESSSG